MKIIVLLSILILSPGYAQTDEGKIGVNLAIGVAQPTQPEFFKDFWRSGVSFGFGATYRVSSSVDAGIELNYHIFSMREQRYLNHHNLLQNFSSISGGARYILAIGGNLKWYNTHFSDYIHPYFIGGIGVLNNRTTQIVKSGVDLEELDDSQSTNMPYIPIGIGLSIYPLETIGISIEGRYLFSMSYESDVQLFISRLLLRVII